MFRFRRQRQSSASTTQSDVSPSQGVVLLDNTTIFGARHAFEWDPALPTQLPAGVDLRSLMDVLEAIVLLNDFVVDASSREHYAWPALNSISAKSGSFFRDMNILTVMEQKLHDVLIEASADKTIRVLRSGELVRHLGFLPSMRELDVLPPLYKSTDQFISLTAPAMFEAGGGLAVAEEFSQSRLRDLASTLEQHDGPIRNFAFFAFRGFYYQDLAHLLSSSYMPHTWRSGLIRDQMERPPVHFSDFVLNETGKLRRTLNKKINHEFGIAALSAEFPLIASYIVGQSRTRGELLETAVEVRRNAKATAFRNWIYEVERNLKNETNLHQVSAAQDELRTVVHELELELGLTRKETQELKLKLAVPLASVETTSRVSRSLPPWIGRVLDRRTHLVFLRELARESTRLAPFAVAFQQLSP